MRGLLQVMVAAVQLSSTIYATKVFYGVFILVGDMAMKASKLGCDDCGVDLLLGVVRHGLRCGHQVQ